MGHGPRWWLLQSTNQSITYIATLRGANHEPPSYMQLLTTCTQPRGNHVRAWKPLLCPCAGLFMGKQGVQVEVAVHRDRTATVLPSVCVGLRSRRVRRGQPGDTPSDSLLTRRSFPAHLTARASTSLGRQERLALLLWALPWYWQACNGRLPAAQRTRIQKKHRLRCLAPLVSACGVDEPPPECF